MSVSICWHDLILFSCKALWKYIWENYFNFTKEYHLRSDCFEDTAASKWKGTNKMKRGMVNRYMKTKNVLRNYFWWLLAQIFFSILRKTRPKKWKVNEVFCEKVFLYNAFPKSEFEKKNERHWNIYVQLCHPG